jgi:hypothetical protein
VICMSFVPIDFPREVLEISGTDGSRGFRRMVKNAEQLESYWRGKNGSGNVYFTAYGYRGTQAPKHHRVDYNTPIIHHFVMDFDCKDFRGKGVEVPFSVPHEQVINLHKYFLDENILHYIWFSGGGFHVWIPLDKTHTPSNGSAVSRIKHAGRKLMNEWDKMFNLRCNDPTVAFDMAGMIRIPNSYNAKRGSWMIPLKSSELLQLDYNGLMELGQTPRRGFISHGTKPVCLEVSNAPIMTMADIKSVDIPTVSLKDIHVLPCLAQAAMGEGNPPHRARVHFASYLADRLRFFFPHHTVSEKEKKKHIQQISAICAEQGWVDYDRSKTVQQVASIVNRGYKHATCSTLYAEGYCLGKCRYYDGSGDVI